MADARQEVNNGTSQSRVVLAKPRLGGVGSTPNFASSSSKGPNPFGSVLRPPQLKPTINPFLKVTEAESKDEKKEEPFEDRLNEKEEVEAPKFVPLETSNAKPRPASTVPTPGQPASSSSGFVFGQNLSERVVMKENVNNGDAADVEHKATNGASELLFTSAAASVKDNNQEEAGPSETTNSGDGLAAAAAEYERSHAKPPPPAEYCTVTGEEDEINVLQISCRLFAWESGSWRERGRGVLRLNDAAGGGGGGGAARLVARVAGSLRVVLNTKLWPEMVVERAGTKSLRITAADAQNQVKLFLIMGAPADIVQLYRALSTRVSMSKRTVAANQQKTTSQQAAERLEAAADVDEFVEKTADYNNEDGEEIVTPVDQPDGRLAHTPTKTDNESTVHNDSNEDAKSLKRKEPANDETSPKRQCPEIVIE